MQVQRLAHGTEAHRSQRATAAQRKHAQRGPEWPPSRGEVSCFGRHTLNTPPASQPQHPQSAARPYPLERHPPPPRWSLHLTSRGGRDRKVSTTSRRLAGVRRDPRRRKLVGRPAVWASSATGRTSRPHRGKQRQAGPSCARYGRPLRGTTF